LGRDYVVGLEPLGSLDYRELYGLPLLEGAIAVALDCAIVDEYIIAGLALYEAVAL